MSIEKQITDLTNAIQLLTATLAGAKVTPPAAITKTEKPAEKPAEKPVEKPVEKPTEAPTLAYDDIKGPFLKMGEVKPNGRDLCAQLLAKHGLGTSLKTAKPEQFAAILADIKAQLPS